MQPPRALASLTMLQPLASPMTHSLASIIPSTPIARCCLAMQPLRALMSSILQLCDFAASGFTDGSLAGLNNCCLAMLQLLASSTTQSVALTTSRTLVACCCLVMQPPRAPMSLTLQPLASPTTHSLASIIPSTPAACCCLAMQPSRAPTSSTLQLCSIWFH